MAQKLRLLGQHVIDTKIHNGSALLDNTWGLGFDKKPCLRDETQKLLDIAQTMGHMAIPTIAIAWLRLAWLAPPSKIGCPPFSPSD